MFSGVAFRAGLLLLVSACAKLDPPSCGGFLPFFLYSWLLPGIFLCSGNAGKVGVLTWGPVVPALPVPTTVPLLLMPRPAAALPKATGQQVYLKTQVKARFRVWEKARGKDGPLEGTFAILEKETGAYYFTLDCLFWHSLKFSDKQQANPSSQQEYINKILTQSLKEKKTRGTCRKGNKRHLGGGTVWRIKNHRMYFRQFVRLYSAVHKPQLYLTSADETVSECGTLRQESCLLGISEGWVGEHEFTCSHLASAFAEGLSQRKSLPGNELAQKEPWNKCFLLLSSWCSA